MHWLSVFCVSVAGGVVPVFATELYVLGAAAALGPSAAVPLVLITAAGQVMGKLFIYAAARRGSVAATARGLKLDKVRAAIGRGGPSIPFMIFVSAFTSLPPWHITTIACGLGRCGAMRFAAAGFAGRMLRAGVLVSLPHLIMEVSR